jgi:uncharacterized repeat protein (TIGR01451 family)
LAATVVVGFLVLAAPASATTRTVANTADTGGGSLRQAVADSGNGDKVVVPAGTYTLTSTNIPITKSIEIEGAGSGATTIATSGQRRIFDLQNSGTVRISKLAIDSHYVDHGGSINGGAIQASATSPLFLTDVRISTVADASGGTNSSGGAVFGAAIYALDNLTLTNTQIDGAQGLAFGGGGATGGSGGAVYGVVNSQKDLSITGSSISSSTMDAHGTGNNSGGAVYGMAVYHTGGTTDTIQHSVFDHNSGSANGSGSGSGGAVYSTLNLTSTSLDMSDVSASHESADANGGGAGGSGGAVFGVSVFRTGSATDTIARGVFDHNTANANGGGSGSGGAVYSTLNLSGPSLNLSDVSASHESGSAKGGASGNSGAVYGLGLYRTAGSTTGHRVTASGNSASAIGGSGHGGGAVYGTGAYVDATNPDTASFDDSVFEGNSGDAHGGTNGNDGAVFGTNFYDGGDGALTLTRTGISGGTARASASGTGNAGAVYGVGLYTSAPATLTNVTIAGNSGNVAAETGTGGAGFGAGVYMSGGGSLTNVTVAGNALTGSGGGALFGANIYPGGTVQAKNTIVADGHAAGSVNCNAPITSLGHNIEDQNECGFHGTGDRFNTDPKLGPLGANGGPSLTRRLLPGSPAINTASTPCSSTDQRGIPRQGPCDIGAYEYVPVDIALSMTAPKKVGIGAQIPYKVTLSNAGPADAFGTVLRDVLPVGLAPAGGAFPPGPCSVAQPVLCPLGTVAHGQAVKGQVLATATKLGTIQNTVGFTSFADDANPANNSATATTKVVHVALGKVKVPSKITAGSKLPLLQPAKRKKKKPQFIVFRLNGPARVTLTFQRKHGKKFKRAGKLVVAGHTGKNKLRFAGRLSKKKRLKPGRYRLVLTAVDRTKHKSKPVKRTFRLVKAKKK